MKTTPALISFLQLREGFRKHAYDDKHPNRELTADTPIFSGSLHKPEWDLLSIDGDAEGDQHLVLGITINEQGNQIVCLEAPVLELPELFCRGFDKPARD